MDRDAFERGCRYGRHDGGRVGPGGALLMLGNENFPPGVHANSAGAPWMYDDGPEPAICPTCGAETEQDAGGEEYCPRCGWNTDWEGESYGL